jgi:hypothetical protein
MLSHDRFEVLKACPEPWNHTYPARKEVEMFMSFCSTVNQQFTAQYYTSACTEYQQYVMIFKWKCAFLGEATKHKKIIFNAQP